MIRDFKFSILNSNIEFVTQTFFSFTIFVTKYIVFFYLLYVIRHLTAELTQEWDEDTAAQKRDESKEAVTTTTQAGFEIITTKDIELVEIDPLITITKDDLLELAKEIVLFYMAHNAEAEACDLLMEIENVDLLANYVEKETYTRVCLYLLRYYANQKSA